MLSSLTPVERLTAIANEVDVATVKRTMETRYPGCTVTDDLCRDFVAFVMAMVLEPDRGRK